MVIGWMGSDYQPPRPDVMKDRETRMEVLHADARIFLFRNFLSHEECDHLIARASPRLKRSGVISTTPTGSGKEEVEDIRTSHGMFFERGEDEVVSRVEARIAAWSLLPVDHGEGFQVLRYGLGQEYRAHWDYFFHTEGTANGGNRAATVLSYLSDVEEGGETVFPFLPVNRSAEEAAQFSACARGQLAVKPRKGDAVLFHSIAPNGALERRSMHAACPVIKGTKWSMAKWLHVARFAVSGDEEWVGVEQAPQAAPRAAQAGCADANEMCDAWALSGECQRNAAYMVGDAARPGACLLSCARCDLAPKKAAR